jgi:hypothetical protein
VPSDIFLEKQTISTDTPQRAMPPMDGKCEKEKQEFAMIESMIRPME